MDCNTETEEEEEKKKDGATAAKEQVDVPKVKKGLPKKQQSVAGAAIGAETDTDLRRTRRKSREGGRGGQWHRQEQRGWALGRQT